MNNTEEYPVYPNINRTIKICKFNYKVLDIKLFESIRIIVYLMNENSVLVDTLQLLITGTEYLAWSQDDTYIVNLIKMKIQQQARI